MKCDPLFAAAAQHNAAFYQAKAEFEIRFDFIHAMPRARRPPASPA
jgi:hypothetical protein